MDVTIVSIDLIFELIVKIYGLLYQSAPLVIEWFMTPLGEIFEGVSIEYTPLELCIGYGLIMVLFGGIVKFFISMASL